MHCHRALTGHTALLYMCVCNVNLPQKKENITVAPLIEFTHVWPASGEKRSARLCMYMYKRRILVIPVHKL